MAGNDPAHCAVRRDCPLDKSARLLYIIRYKCSAKECARIVLLQQAGG